MARDFNGTSSDYLNFADNTALDLTTVFTISAKVYLDSFQNDSVVWAKSKDDDDSGPFSGALWFGVTSSGKLEIVLRKVEAIIDSGAETVSTGSWFDWAVTHTGTSYKFYVNGVLSSDKTSGNNAANNAFDLEIGWNGRIVSGDFDEFVDGRIAEVAAWKRALSGEEVAGLADGFSALFYPNSLSAYIPIIGRYSPEIELVGGNTGTVNGTTAASHPRIIYPTSKQIRGIATAAAGTVVQDLIQSGVIPFAR